MQQITPAELCALARALGVALDEPMAARLLRLLDELVQWNRAYNLTSIETHAAMVSGHLLDSLSASTELAGMRIADLGTGAGFPGLPLAIAHPQRQFTLIDGTAKKVRFVAHAARALGLANVEPVHARAENMPALAPFDTVIARAVAPLPKLASLALPMSRAGTRLLAMKGKRPVEELKAIPAEWELLSVREVSVPGLNAERCLVSLVARPALQQTPSSPASG